MKILLKLYRFVFISVLLVFVSCAVFGMEKTNNKYNYQATCELQRILQEDVNVPIIEIRRQIDAGANPNIARADGATVLHIAIWLNELDLVTYLLNKGANPNSTRDRNFTPLMDVIVTEGLSIKAKLAIATRLLDGEANVLIQDNKGNTVLHHAILYRNNLALIKLFVTHNSSIGSMLKTIKNKRGEIAKDLKGVPINRQERKIDRFLSLKDMEKIK